MPLKVHFLNVGHGDCIVVKHASGRITLIDINNGSELDTESLLEVSSELPPRYGGALGLRGMVLNKSQLQLRGYNIETTNPIEFISKRYPGTGIIRYIQSHPHMDHMRGIAALVRAGMTPENFWDTVHNEEPEIQEADIEDWETYLAFRNGHFKETKVLRLNRGATGKYYNREEDDSLGGDGIEILAPTPELQKYASENGKVNELSYVLRISHGGRSMILGGDAESETWKDIYEHYGDKLYCQVLKASHHGRASGYYQPAVKAMAPTFTIVSVGKKPETDASNLYRQYSKEVWSTRWKGNISITFPDSIAEPFLYEWEYDR